MVGAGLRFELGAAVDPDHRPGHCRRLGLPKTRLIICTAAPMRAAVDEPAGIDLSISPAICRWPFPKAMDLAEIEAKDLGRLIILQAVSPVAVSLAWTRSRSPDRSAGWPYTLTGGASALWRAGNSYSAMHGRAVEALRKDGSKPGIFRPMAG